MCKPACSTAKLKFNDSIIKFDTQVEKYPRKDNLWRQIFVISNVASFCLTCSCRYIIYWYLLSIYVISELAFKTFLKTIYFEHVSLSHGNLLELYLICCFFSLKQKKISFLYWLAKVIKLGNGHKKISLKF